jgi:hypothetical protein
LRFEERFAPRATEFHLFAGDGCYVPYQWPHWVRTASSYSISMAMRKVLRRIALGKKANYYLKDA